MTKEELLALDIPEEKAAQIAEAFAEAAQTAEQEKNALIVDHAISTAIQKAGARNEKAVRGMLELQRITVENGEVTGLDEQIETLLCDKSTAFLFGDEDALKLDGAAGAAAGESTDETDLPADYAGMTYEEIAAALAE